MANKYPTEKVEIIERALQEAVGGGAEHDVCAITCSIFSIDVCHIDRCSVSTPEQSLA